MDLQNSEQKIDLNSMSNESVDQLSAQIGERIRLICDEAVEKANKILAIYGLTSKMQIQINELGKESIQEPSAPNKRGRKPKAKQS